MPDVWIPAAPTSAMDRAAMPHCPRCRSDLMRVPRRPQDRLLSWFTPVRRYRCLSFRCQWEGNVRVDRRAQGWSESQRTARGDLGLEQAEVPGGVPTSFVIAITLAVAGLVFVVVGTATDWLLPDQTQEGDQSSDVWQPPASHGPPATVSASQR